MRREIYDIDENASQYLLPIKNGGTSASTQEGAANNLGVILKDKINKPNGVLGLDEDGFIDPRYFPATLNIGNAVNIEGPLEIRAGEANLYKITNYDSFTNYVVTSNNLIVTRSEDSLLVEVETVAPTAWFAVNGSVFPVVILGQANIFQGNREFELNAGDASHNLSVYDSTKLIVGRPSSTLSDYQDGSIVTLNISKSNPIALETMVFSKGKIRISVPTFPTGSTLIVETSSETLNITSTGNFTVQGWGEIKVTGTGGNSSSNNEGSLSGAPLQVIVEDQILYFQGQSLGFDKDPAVTKILNVGEKRKYGTSVAGARGSPAMLATTGIEPDVYTPHGGDSVFLTKGTTPARYDKSKNQSYSKTFNVTTQGGFNTTNITSQFPGLTYEDGSSGDTPVMAANNDGSVIVLGRIANYAPAYIRVYKKISAGSGYEQSFLFNGITISGTTYTPGDIAEVKVTKKANGQPNRLFLSFYKWLTTMSHILVFEETPTGWVNIDRLVEDVGENWTSALTFDISEDGTKIVRQLPHASSGIQIWKLNTATNKYALNETIPSSSFSFTKTSLQVNKDATKVFQLRHATTNINYIQVYEKNESNTWSGTTVYAETEDNFPLGYKINSSGDTVVYLNGTQFKIYKKTNVAVWGQVASAAGLDLARSDCTITFLSDDAAWFTVNRPVGAKNTTMFGARFSKKLLGNDYDPATFKTPAFMSHPFAKQNAMVTTETGENLIFNVNGSGYDTNGGYYSGSIYVAKTELVKEVRTIEETKGVFPYFGSSSFMSSDGLKAIVGAKGLGNFTYYEFSGSDYAEVSSSILGADGATKGFGTVVHANSTISQLIAGLPLKSPSGAVCFGTRSGTTITWGSEFTPANLPANTKVGQKVWLSEDGNTSILNAYGDPSTNNAVIILEKSGSNWIEKQRIQSPEVSFTNTAFAKNFRLSETGNVLFVGAPGMINSAGAVYVYELKNGSFQFSKLVRALNPAINDQFGEGLEAIGDELIVSQKRGANTIITRMS